MKNRSRPYLMAAGLGVLAGMRSLSPLALLSRRSRHWVLRRGALQKIVTSSLSAKVLPVLAAGEMIADKTPQMPSRIEIIPLAGRIGMGALSALLVSRAMRNGRTSMILTGGATAAASTFAFYHLRKSLHGRGAPNVLLGLAEDALVLAIGARLEPMIRRT